MNKSYTVVLACYSNSVHKQAIAELMALYSGDIMGGGVALPSENCHQLADALSDFGYANTVLAFADGEPIGMATSLKSFSTFALKPLLNIHDFYVVPQWRGVGVGVAMLEKTQSVARKLGCCKLTLEVLGNNLPAKSLYQKFGFEAYQLAESAGCAEFWQKPIG